MMQHDEHMDVGAAPFDNVIVTEAFSGWRTKLIKNNDKRPKACLANILTALRHAPEWNGVLRFDAFAHRIVMAAAPPWVVQRNEWLTRPWADDDDCRTAEWMQRQGIMARLADVGPAIASVARERSYHPVREYLDSLHWDCNERLDSVMPKLFGVTPTPYSSAVFRCTLIAAVARIMDPGCKVDTVLMLEGTQGKRKSSAIERLFSKPWFTDDLADLGTKDSAMQMAGVWCIEIADLASMKRADIDKVKAFITRKVDRFRPPYGRNVIEAPRSSILIATTNLDDWGKDETGGRRFWPVQCEGEIDIPGISQLRDQLWAEAVALHRAEEPWWLVDRAVIQRAQEEVENRAAGDPWDVRIQRAVADKTSVTVEEILDSVLNVEKARQRRNDQMRVVAILKRLHWRKERPMKGGVRVTVYLAPNA